METPEEKVTRIEAEIKAAQEAAKNSETKLAELIKSTEAKEAEIKATKEAVEQANANIQKLQSGLNVLTKKIDGIKTETKEQTIVQAVANLIASEEFKADLKNKAFESKGGKSYEIKASTSDLTVDVTRTMMLPGVSFPRDRNLAFLPNLMQGGVGQDKNRIGYIEGSYTSKVGYVGEGQKNANLDEVSAVERYREMAKASARIKVTEEMFEDASYIASRISNQMMTKGMLFLDREIFSGNGDDSSNPNHIYGLKGAATAFDATKAGLKNAVDSANIGDLADAMRVQGSIVDASKANSDQGSYDLNVIYMNPVTAYKYAHTKSPDGNYIINTLTDGTKLMAGMRVIETPAIGTSELFAMESGLAEVYFKRNPIIKIGQEDDDLSKDQYTMVMFLRAQVLVETENKKGLIYVADIDAALASITKTASEGM